MSFLWHPRGLGDARWRQEQTSGQGHHIIDIIAHKLLDMVVREQTGIDRRRVETLDGTNNEWCWSRAKFSANATLATSMTVCRAGAATKVSLCLHISKLTGKPTDKFMMLVLCFNVISGGSHAGNCLACPEFLIVHKLDNSLFFHSPFRFSEND